MEYPAINGDAEEQREDRLGHGKRGYGRCSLVAFEIALIVHGVAMDDQQGDDVAFAQVLL